MSGRTKPVRARDLKAKKKRGERITMLTAYDATMARLLDRAGIDALLVGDSMGMVIMGEATTIPVTLDAMIHHTRAVTRGAKRALVVADMPFMTYQVSVAEALRNAGRLIQEGGASAVKLEGGRGVVETTARLVEVGIPVMGHLGLTPQSVHQQGFRPQARHPEDAEELLAEARAIETAGAFALVLESIPADVAATVTGALQIPTIGIGAGPFCDGQVLVSYDAFGLFDEFVPSFVKRYANLGDDMVAATERYITDVREGRFPAHEHTVAAPASGSKPK
jgi:3-methyl-2-oxobutanoate hydroxymethyltransferase